MSLYIVVSFYMTIQSISHKKKKAAIIWGCCLVLPIAVVIVLIFGVH